MKFVLPAIATALAYAVWHWAALLVDPMGLGEFLFVCRAGLIAAVLTAAEMLFHKVAP